MEDYDEESIYLDDRSSRHPRVFALQREEDESGAMSNDKRTKIRIRSVAKKLSAFFSFLGGQNRLPAQNPRPKQYRIDPRRSTLSHYFLGTYKKRSSDFGMVVPKSHLNLSSYLHWMFRVNFFVLFGLSCMAFFVFTTFFAGLIFAFGSLYPQCVRVGGKEFIPSMAGFADAFSLSWTTFSTVGYGNVYPATGPQNNTKDNCLLVTTLCSLECFFGVLYSGFCGAILFGKVLRLQSRAQVLFSDPMVIRYGLGVLSQKKYKTTLDGKKCIPCPVLEFRVLNKLFNDVGGEIIDATLNVVASIDTYDNDGNEFNQSGNLQAHESMNWMELDPLESVKEEKGQTKDSTKFMQRIFQHYSTRWSKNTDPSCSPVKKRIFTKLALEVSDHPFFKRAWVARHILDENSPILTPRVRRMIRRRMGRWPEELNNYQGIKDSLNFDQILVSLNGVSNLSASCVYAQKIYEDFNVYVGYQFVNLLYRDDDDIKIHMKLINDVREQYGGGGEPLTLSHLES